MSGRPKQDPHGKQFSEVKGFVSLHRGGQCLNIRQFSNRSKRNEVIAALTAESKRLQRPNQVYYIHITYNE